jgi:hypothetical protein
VTQRLPRRTRGLERAHDGDRPVRTEASRRLLEQGGSLPTMKSMKTFATIALALLPAFSSGVAYAGQNETVPPQAVTDNTTKQIPCTYECVSLNSDGTCNYQLVCP